MSDAVSSVNEKQRPRAGSVSHSPDLQPGGSKHIPVLLHKVVEYLAPQPGGVYLDATLGGGGYTFELLKRSGERGRVLAIDADPAAIQRVLRSPEMKIFSGRLTAVNDNFSDLGRIATRENFSEIDGAVFDLGLSSDELADPERGFAFQIDGHLDMRFDFEKGKNASDLLMKADGRDLEKIFREYGEERYARRIAGAIVSRRSEKPIERTGDLAEIVRTALPASARRYERNTLARVFQALRIAVNDELENLSKALPQAFELLRPGGRLAVVSFHSLEDRIVKRYFKNLAHACVCPPEFPECQCGKSDVARILTRKPVIPDEGEIIANPRSASAKLRVAEKL